MPTHWQLAQRLRPQGTRHRALYLFAFVILFWTMFDNVMTYLAPLVLTQRGLSNTMMGIVYSSSSVAGGLFDFVMSKFVKRASYRRILLVMFGLCFLYPLILWNAKVLWMFLFAMAWWGVYFDLFSFSAFDFVGRFQNKEHHATSFGIIHVFRSLGGIIAPLIVGLIVIDRVNFQPFLLAWTFLIVGTIFLIALLFQSLRPVSVRRETELRTRRPIHELRLWRTVGRALLPVLSLSFFLFFIEAFFWTLAPLYAKQLQLHGFGGLLLTVYALPALLMGWFVGQLTQRWGKKRTAFVALLIGSAIIATFAAVHSPYVIIALTFAAACFLSVSLPSINGAYADYIAETPDAEREIAALQDFVVNLGYIAGPLLAGILADAINIPGAFTTIGLTGVIVALILLKVTPRSITVLAK